MDLNEVGTLLHIAEQITGHPKYSAIAKFVAERLDEINQGLIDAAKEPVEEVEVGDEDEPEEARR